MVYTYYNMNNIGKWPEKIDRTTLFAINSDVKDDDEEEEK